MAIGKKTGGRTKGTLNKATADVKVAALEYAPSALTTLNEIMTSVEQPAAARVAAANAILDRAYGKPKQSMEVDGTLDVRSWLNNLS